MTVRIINGDCREVLPTLAADSFDCIVTSPPYFGLRDCGVEGQIGLEPTLDAYVEQMVGVFDELKRVLKPSGTVFLNLGDSYFASGPRHTGRNDTNRETPGGRGGSFRGGVRRAISCDKPDKEPANSLANDCFCRSLCDACREAYRIGISHSVQRPSSTRPASNSASIRERTGLLRDRLPMSGSVLPVDRIEVSTLDLQHLLHHEAAPPLSSPASMPSEYSQQPPEENLRSGQLSECRLCGRSLEDCVPASASSQDCTCDTDETSDASAHRMSDKESSGSAYPHYTTTSLKPKDLCGVPWRVAFALQARGWWLRSEVIWAKPNGMPGSQVDRCTSSHETVFLLSKSADYWSDFDAIKTPPRESTLVRTAQNIQAQAGSHRANGGGKANGAMKAVGGLADKQRGHSRRHDGFNDRWDAMSKEEQQSSPAMMRDVWFVPPQPNRDAHFAIMPAEIARRCILAGCPSGGHVLDPFGGAGTTGLVADRLGRDATLIELNPTYRDMGAERIRDDMPLFAEVQV